MNNLSKTELLEKANDWISYIARQEDEFWHFKFHPPEYYRIFQKMAKYDRDVECFERHIERCKRIYNRIINQLQTKNF